MSIKGDLIKIGAELITRCPVSPYLEDMELPYKIGVKNARHIQRQLDKMDNWLKDIAIKLRVAADSLEENSDCRTTRHSTPNTSPQGEICPVCKERLVYKEMKCCTNKECSNYAT